MKTRLSHITALSLALTQDPLGENTLLEGGRELGPRHFSVGPTGPV